MCKQRGNRVAHWEIKFYCHLKVHKCWTFLIVSYHPQIFSLVKHSYVHTNVCICCFIKKRDFCMICNCINCVQISLHLNILWSLKINDNDMHLVPPLLYFNASSHITSGFIELLQLTAYYILLMMFYYLNNFTLLALLYKIRCYR